MGRMTLMDLIKLDADAGKDDRPVSEIFMEDLEKIVDKLNPFRRPSKNIKPSSLNCKRKMYFDMTEAPIDPDAYLSDYNGTRILETGTASHESLQYYISKMNQLDNGWEWVDVEEYIKEKKLDYLEVKSKKEYETHLFDTRYGISFLCDGLLKYKGKYYILEIKTEVDFKSKNRNSEDEYHKKQSLCYSLCLQIYDIIWLYEERNFCSPKTFDSFNSEHEVKDLEENTIQYVIKCVAEGTVPEKTELIKTCNYCPYRKECVKWR